MSEAWRLEIGGGYRDRHLRLNNMIWNSLKKEMRWKLCSLKLEHSCLLSESSYGAELVECVHGSSGLNYVTVIPWRCCHLGVDLRCGNLVAKSRTLI